MKKLMIAVVCLALWGCNTVDGIGRDISAGANTVQNSF